MKKLISFVFCSLFLLTGCSTSYTNNQPTPDSIIDDVSDVLSGRIIILDAGHGTNENMYVDYDEGATMQKLSLIIKPLLEEHGATVHLTRKTEDKIELATRAAYANIISLETLLEINQAKLIDALEADKSNIQSIIDEINYLLPILYNLHNDPLTYQEIYTNSPYDYSEQRIVHPDLKRVLELQDNIEIASRFLFLSLHSNSTQLPIDTSFNGIDSFYIDDTINYYDGYKYTLQNELFANLILDNLSTLGFKRNIAQANNYHVIREMNIPSILVENGFHTNENDQSILTNNDYLEQIAIIYANTIIEYFSSALVPNIPNN